MKIEKKRSEDLNLGINGTNLWCVKREVVEEPLERNKYELKKIRMVGKEQ